MFGHPCVCVIQYTVYQMADDKKAFEAMLDELDSSSDEEADSKQPVRPVAGAKPGQDSKAVKSVAPRAVHR